jgi:predicted aspartyl protease
MAAFEVSARMTIVLTLGAATATAADTDALPSLQRADALFKAGKFAEADRAYARLVRQDPRSYRAVARLGYLALLSNRLDDARQRLEDAIRLQPSEAAPKLLLAEVFFRRDDFARAAPLLRASGQEARAKQLESFKGLTPYEVQARTGHTSLRFVATDPLPVLRVRVNGGPDVNFFIDTGASEVVLDTEFAKEAGAKLFGSLPGTFAGGKQANVQLGRIDSLTLGEFTVKNVPVMVVNTRQFSWPVFGGRRVDGILGTVLFYHFLTTLNYPGGELVLRRDAKKSLAALEKEAGGGNSVAVPFWMAGDHYMVAWGRIDKAPPALLFVDTGLAGAAVTLAESAIKEAGIQLTQKEAGEGLGAGGKVKVVPFVVRELSLGKVTERNVRGVYLGSFPLEDAMGFRIAGIISHGFLRPYALTFDFRGMRLFLRRGG